MMNKARAASGTQKGRNFPAGASMPDPVTQAVFLEAVRGTFGLNVPYQPLEILSALGVPGLFGTDPNFNRPITRGEAVEILMRAMTE